MRKALLFLPLLFLLVPIVNAGITYSAPTITVVGGSKAVPYTFLDIYNADVAGGWGVVTKTSGGSQFQFNAKIVLSGTSGTITWFNDTNKQITFLDGVLTSDYSIFIQVNRAYVRFGKPQNVALKVGTDGCDFISLDTHYHSVIIDLHAASLGCQLYATNFKHPYTSKGGFIYDTQYGSNNRMWGCTFVNVRPSRIGGSDDIYRCNIVNCNVYGIYYGTTVTSIEDVFLANCNTADIWLSAGTYILRNIKTQTKIKFLVFGGASSFVYAINCYPSQWTFGYNGVGSILYRQYTWNSLIKDNLGLPIQNANVTLYRFDGTLAFTVLTYANGTIPKQTVTRGYYAQPTGNTLNDYGPFTLQIEATGYLPHTIFNITLGEPIDWTIALSTVQITTTIPLSFLVFTSIASIITIYGYKNQIPRERMLAFGFGILFWFAVIWQWVSDNTGTSTLMLVTIFLAPLFACFAWFMQSLGVYIDKINSKEEYDDY